MRKTLFFLLLLVLLSQSCQRQSAPPALTIAAAANMQFALKDLVKVFSEQTGIRCETIISSSGKLTAQITQGAPFDIFISADTKYPEILYQNGLTTGPAKIYARGIPVLWTTTDSLPVTIDVLTKNNIKHIALANPKNAPYGRAAVEILKHHGIFKKIKNKLVYGENVAQASQFILSGAAPIGFTAKSVVLSPTLAQKGKWIEWSPTVYTPIEQAAVILKNSNQMKEARLFYDFLFSEKGKKILRRYGFY